MSRRRLTEDLAEGYKLVLGYESTGGAGVWFKIVKGNQEHFAASLDYYQTEDVRDFLVDAVGDL